jgi:hypothetical protein
VNFPKTVAQVRGDVKSERQNRTGLFNTWLPFVASTMAIGLIVAFCCGRWGDSAWEFLLYFLLWTLG